MYKVQGTTPRHVDGKRSGDALHHGEVLRDAASSVLAAPPCMRLLRIQTPSHITTRNCLAKGERAGSGHALQAARARCSAYSACCLLLWARRAEHLGHVMGIEGETSFVQLQHHARHTPYITRICPGQAQDLPTHMALLA